MVPDSFHDFFVATASVAGALIGLLFVAISISTAPVAGEGADGRLRLRAAAAFAALVNPLVISLAALIPETELFVAPLTLAAMGIASSLVVLAVLARGATGGGWREVALQVALLAAYGVQLLSALQLHAEPDDLAPLQRLAVLMIVFFLIGIFRAWELVGAGAKGLHGALAALRAHADAGDAER